MDFWPPPFTMRRSDGLAISEFITETDVSYARAYFSGGSIPGFHDENTYRTSIFSDPELNYITAVAGCSGLTGATGAACRQVKTSGKPLPKPAPVCGAACKRGFQRIKTPQGIRRLRGEQAKLRASNIKGQRESAARITAQNKREAAAARQRVAKAKQTLADTRAAIDAQNAKDIVTEGIRQGVGAAGELGKIPKSVPIPIVGALISTGSIIANALTTGTPIDGKAIADTWTAEMNNIGNWFRDVGSKGAIKDLPKYGAKVPGFAIPPAITIPLTGGELGKMKAEMQTVAYARGYY